MTSFSSIERGLMAGQRLEPAPPQGQRQEPRLKKISNFSIRERRREEVNRLARIPLRPEELIPRNKNRSSRQGDPKISKSPLLLLLHPSQQQKLKIKILTRSSSTRSTQARVAVQGTTASSSSILKSNNEDRKKDVARESRLRPPHQPQLTRKM